MAAYDRLPACVREALGTATFSYAPQVLLTAFRRGRSPEALIAIIQGWDAQELASAARERDGERCSTAAL